jgi:hypothetical protein
LIVGGIVFRVVTPSHPGDPKLDKAGAPPIRTEWLADDAKPWEWTIYREGAYFFETHLNAEIVAKEIPHCHASVATPRNQASIPERLKAIPESVLPPSIVPAARAPRPAKKKMQIDPFREAQCRRDPVEA